MTRVATLSKVTSTATLVAVLVTAVLGAIGNDSWHTAFAVALALLGARLAVMAWETARRELPVSRLLVPGIVFLEGVRWWSRGGEMLWQVRLGIAVALEVVFVVVAIRELRRTVAGNEPLEARMARAFSAMMPLRAARLVAFELVIVGSALRFAFGGWRGAVPAGFTYHRESGLRMMLPILPLLGIGDILLLELVILPEAAMWLRVVLHAVAIYGLIWLIGLYASVRARPHQLVDGRLMLHRGILRRLDVPVNQIAAIGALPSFADDWKKRAYCKGAIRIDIAGATVLELRLHAALRPVGVLGEGGASTRVLVAVDEPVLFTQAIEGHGATAPSDVPSTSTT